MATVDDVFESWEDMEASGVREKVEKLGREKKNKDINFTLLFYVQKHCHAFD